MVMMWPFQILSGTSGQPGIKIRKGDEEDGTKKIFLNMTSKNGSKELVSLLQYMKNTSLDNPEIEVKDERLIRLDEIVNEVKESICDAVEKYAPNYDVKKIYADMKEAEKDSMANA